MERIYFAAGCFWGVQAAFDEMTGVSSTQAGYAGGHADNPTYEDVCSGKTGHAEVVEVCYNASVVSLAELLEKFWQIHDPTQVNRQGVDIGTQYRSAVYYTTQEQKAIVEASIDGLRQQKRYLQPVVTEVKEAGSFFPAEAYHQNYFKKQSCSI